MAILPQYDSEKHYLGTICLRGHEYNNTGMSLRAKRNRTCVVCHVGHRNNFDVTHRDKVKLKQRKGDLLRNFGIQISEYNSLFNKQNGVCAICGHTSNKNLCVDHNHSTGEIRGLLCDNCNIGLGNFKDDISRLVSAIEYLRTFDGFPKSNTEAA